jgi:cytidyltransferase-like protein
MIQGSADEKKSGGTLVSTTKKMMNRPSNFLTTSNFVQLFSQPLRMRPKDAKVIYIDGAWDMFHSGHIKTLERARAMGDYLIVGVVNDEVVNQHRGANYPIMNLNERVLSVVGCQYADDVLIDAPWEITADMIKSLNVHTVVAGTTHDEKSTAGGKEPSYKVAREMGIFKEIKSDSSLTVTQIVSRILAKEQQYRTTCTDTTTPPPPPSCPSSFMPAPSALAPGTPPTCAPPPPFSLPLPSTTYLGTLFFFPHALCPLLSALCSGAVTDLCR